MSDRGDDVGVSDRRIFDLARSVLDPPEFDVWLSKHVYDRGRRSGSLALGITEEAWRYRLNSANRKVDIALRLEAA